MRRVSAIGIALTLGVVGCGGSGGGGDKDASKVKAVIDQSVTSSDPQVECVTTVTPHFVTTVFGSLQACKAKYAKPDRQRPTSDTIRDLKVSGDTATAVVTLSGGAISGATGPIDLAKQKGTWKVDGFGAGFMRSELKQGLTNSTDPALASAGLKSCLLSKLNALSDSDVTAVAYDGLAGRDNPQLTQIGNACAAQLGLNGQSTSDLDAAKQHAEQLVTTIGRSHHATKKQLACVLGRMEKTVTDEQLLAQAKAGTNLTPAFATALAAAIKAC